MNVLIFRGTDDIDGIDYAVEYQKKGDTVTVIQCDSSMGVCPWNPYANKICCKYCYRVSKKAFDRICPSGVAFFSLSSLINEEDRKKSEAYPISFNSIAELKNILYDNVEIGYGAFSSYATTSRNVMPDISQAFKDYITFMMRMEIRNYEAIKRFVSSKHIDLIIFHNGRFAMYRPILGVAKNKGIDYIATEHLTSNGKKCKNDFWNSVPHSVHSNMKKARELWEKTEKEKREERGKNFYEWRKNGKPAGDKVYTKLQQAGKLPDEWDENVENIAIFNSSEDEQCAISKQIDSQNLFENQYVALSKLFEHYKDDKTKHFYLRIHPNLIEVPYRSHTALYELKYDNVSIFPPDSPISSYALLVHCDKVIVFNSTMGLEAAYWNKPVIALVRDYASEFNLAYFPETEKRFWELVDDKSLKSLKNDDALIMGNYFLRDEPVFSNIPINMKDRFFGKEVLTESVTKFLGSYALNRMIFKLFNTNKIRITSKFDIIPETVKTK